MTLDTRIWLHGPIDGDTAFRLALRALLAAADREAETSTAQVVEHAAGTLPDWLAVHAHSSGDPAGAAARAEKYRRRHDTISTVIGQGLPGIVECDYHADGSPLASEDVYDEDEGEGYLSQRACQVQLSWDTGYGYEVRKGFGCTELHARALVLLHASLPDGVTMTWRNEYSGEVFDGLDGLPGFLGDGGAANDWFRNVALPAVTADILADWSRGPR